MYINYVKHLSSTKLQVHQLLPPSNQATAGAHQFAYTILSQKPKQHNKQLHGMRLLSFSIQENSSTSTSFSPSPECPPSKLHQQLIHGSPPSQSKARLLFLQTSNRRQPILLPDLVSLVLCRSSALLVLHLYSQKLKYESD